MTEPTTTIRVVRVFVSSPGDVAEERRVLEEVAERINRTDGRSQAVRLELWKWEDDAVPRIGPPPQVVVDAQAAADYDVYLGILAYRFGTPTGRYGSGTEKEFRDALRRWGQTGRPWILFYFKTAKVDVDELDLDQYAKVRKFREQVQTKGLYATYDQVRGTADAFFEQVDTHLRGVVQAIAPLASCPTAPMWQADATAYLRDLLDETAHIDIRGFGIGTGKAYRFPIELLFISLTATQLPTERDEQLAGSRRQRRAKAAAGPLGEEVSVPLHQALQNNRLVVVGHPGTGKTTFLRRVAHALCQTQLGADPTAARERLGITDRTLPVFVRLNELAEHLLRRHYAEAPVGAEAPAWLPHFLAAVSQSNRWGLDGDYFVKQLESGRCTILLDGMDEVPERLIRERITHLIENTARKYHGCRFVVTSRPAAYTEDVILPSFARATINPLSDDVVHLYLSRWCDALYAESRDAADAHLHELNTAISSRPDIRAMARNPMMLTALAVVHWNERRLPEQRADLYESIIRWLSRSRELKHGREKGERSIVLLQELALRMQDHPSGVQTEVPRRWAAEQLAGEWADGRFDTGSIRHAEAFLDAEEMDSGIVVVQRERLQFWHRAFQDFLAARALAARPTDECDGLFRRRPSLLCDDSWRDVLRLLAQVLFYQGPHRVDRFISAILSGLGEDATFEEKTKCFELVASMEEDLAPLGYDGRNGLYDRLRQDIQGELVRQLARSTWRTETLSQIGEIVAKLPEGQTGFLKETPRIRAMVQEIAEIQNRLDTISQPVLREPYARLLLTEIENFQYRIRGFSEPLGEEFTKASEAWLQIARSQLSIAESIARKEALPQVFRAGDPVDRDREAFVVRYAVMGEIERQVMLSSGCPGIVLYARRRMGKSTALRNLPAFLPKTVRIAAISMQRPQAFLSLASLMHEVTEAVHAVIAPAQTPDQIPEDLGGFYRLVQRWNQCLQDRGERLIIAFDEYENIDEKLGAGVFPLDLLATIRESIQSHRHLTWLFSGSHEITELHHAEWTSYLVSARTIEIPPFSDAETRALLTDPMRHSSLWPDESRRPRFPVEVWGPSGIERIHAEAGGWPHLVQLIAETAVDLLNAETETRLTKALLERALDKAIVSGHNVLHQLLRKESRLPGEWDYLAAFKTNDSQPPPADESLARSLQRRLLVEQTPDGQWRLRVPLLQRWLRKRG